MGILGMIESMGSGSDNSRVAGGLVQEIEQRSGGIGGLLNSLHQNGMGDQVQQWAGGQPQAVSSTQIENGLGSTGIINSISQRTGLSPATVTAGLGIAVPILIHHLASMGHVTPQGQPTGTPAPNGASVLQSVLSRIIRSKFANRGRPVATAQASLENYTISCASKNFSTSRAAMQPDPDAVIAWR